MCCKLWIIYMTLFLSTVFGCGIMTAFFGKLFYMRRFDDKNRGSELWEF